MCRCVVVGKVVSVDGYSPGMASQVALVVALETHGRWVGAQGNWAAFPETKVKNSGCGSAFAVHRMRPFLIIGRSVCWFFLFCWFCSNDNVLMLLVFVGLWCW